MSSYRYRKNHIVYARHTKKARENKCQFCAFTAKSDQVIKELKFFWVVKNIFPYDSWDHSGVKDHLMLVPKRHIDAIGKFKPAEGKEFFEIVGQYDKQGYSIYARAPGNVIKSVPHQHTHLISTDNKPKRFLFFLKKPHIMFTK